MRKQFPNRRFSESQIVLKGHYVTLYVANMRTYCRSGGCLLMIFLCSAIESDTQADVCVGLLVILIHSGHTLENMLTRGYKEYCCLKVILIKLSSL